MSENPSVALIFYLAAILAVAILGHGTVGSAFEALLAERADAFVPITGMRPEVTGVLTRSRGSFDEILAGSDLIVEKEWDRTGAEKIIR